MSPGLVFLCSCIPCILYVFSMYSACIQTSHPEYVWIHLEYSRIPTVHRYSKSDGGHVQNTLEIHSKYIGIHPREMYSKHLAESVAERTRIRTEYIKIRTKGMKTPNYLP